MEHHYMKLAIDMAKNTKGQTSPNPSVGCVIVKNNQITGVGAHLKAGEAHAERQALEMAKEKASGATMFVTLEPCSHYGRTPPCADAVIEAGISKVFIASTDPNPQVAGKGIEKLEKAGIEVDTGLMKEEADEINREFFHFISTGKPFVTLKTACSIDGKIATSTGESKWITGEEARKDGYRLRHEHDAILCGVGTVIEDNPSLTARLEDGGNNPVRIVLDTRLRMPLDSNLITDKLAETWIITTSLAEKEKINELEKHGVYVLQLESSHISIDQLLSVLGDKQITSLLVEGGGKVNDSFLRTGQFQRVVKYMAPLIIGGEKSKSSFSGEGIPLLKDTPHLKLHSMEPIGSDTKFVFYKREDN
ncbi:bifunctional diaminohydroxyphosphoribosylaminopyrimidine deaminase/5-amino-6-(5-phosphoribosylamino)uracil reductase RibD [Salipaludibacillus aurantiacus]|uniref:Riboflavin biosynthesis protein RibD n=1 Tax=Salipaludibacillus aurantiacus TaxID=1601833 RepID=A0A1H9PE10_9BACI|nr:bifunctional diaminohydroxyphosphoribosylaminopyrimidine deaminase/5-amino-6-(5-phosphoribosylamino)uracil reductase RibD [Salipaludibacillus aurantiacus]SER46414.1 diaminohydroxyphosphoribosylaminopyrimidine deaminase / 5-amino-6-(5-phosphoribosylamino)uracil reductase [Salipaludibacillus aurantiacus]